MATCCVETTSFCLFCICLLSIFFGGLSSSWSRTHSEQSILTHCLCDSWIVLTFVIYLTPLFIFPDWRVLIQKSSLKSLHLIISYSELILHFFVMLFFFFPLSPKFFSVLLCPFSLIYIKYASTSAWAKVYLLWKAYPEII